MLEALMQNYKAVGVGLLGVVFVATIVFRKQMRWWLWAGLSLVAVMALVLIVAGESAVV